MIFMMLARASQVGGQFYGQRGFERARDAGAGFV